MTPLIGVVLVLAMSSDPESAAAVSVNGAPRSGSELREATEAALRRWARVPAAEADQAARDFLALYEELAADRELLPARRESLRARVRYRLGELSRQISRRIAKEEAVDAAQDVRHVAAPPGFTFSAQLLPQPRGGGAGPAPIRAGFAGQPAQRPGQAYDNGQALVELIQRVIAPSTWDVNGGNGSIRYWRPGHALVVRQTEQVHENVGGLLRQLERANR
jgi:hypothetical protein